MKKHLPLFFTVLFCVITGFLQAQGSLTPEILYYKFDGSGTIVPNYASGATPATDTANILGGVTQGGSGTLCNGALIGSGVSSTTDYLNTGWAPNVGTGPWTISVRVSGITTSGTLFYIFGDLNTTSFRCFTNGVAGSTNWIIRGAGLTDTYINGGALATPTMITYVYDTTGITLGNDAVRGYLNGVQVSSVLQTGTPNLTGAGPFKVMGYSSNVGAPAGGLMDEFRFYNRALTNAEILQLYNPFTPSGFLGPDQPLCPSTPIELALEWPTTSVLWSDASTNDSILINVADTFTVSVSGTCGVGSDTIIFTSLATNGAVSPITCGNYTGPSGAIFTSTGLYTDTVPNAAGCDSIISIDLLVNTSSSSMINPNVCAVDYMAPSGAIYSVSGLYSDTIPNAVGCDSIIFIDLTLANHSSSNINPTLCGGIYTAPSGSTHNSTSVFSDTIPNFAGCDSVITINLTITNVNTGVSQAGTNGQNLSALGIGTYQWINCPSFTPIAGETFGNFTATANGMYAVIVTQNGCTDTSACFTVSGLSINQNLLADMIKLYPNPTTGAFTINIGMINESFTIELINNVGQVVRSSVFTNANVGTFEIEGPSGLYFVRITDSHGEKVSLRVIKE